MKPLPGSRGSRVPAKAVATGNEVQFALIMGSHWTVYQVTIALR